VTLADGVTSDPTAPAAASSPYSAANSYMTKTYLDNLPKKPNLTLIWFRSPGSNEHAYGPGSPNYLDAPTTLWGLSMPTRNAPPSVAAP
jgi:hypothetical protein